MIKSIKIGKKEDKILPFLCFSFCNTLRFSFMLSLRNMNMFCLKNKVHNML